VAAEAALQWVGWQTCQQQLQVVRPTPHRADNRPALHAEHRRRFDRPSQDAQVQCSRRGHSSQTQQAARCELTVKALAALTALPEPDYGQNSWSPCRTDDAINNSIASVVAAGQNPGATPDVQAAARAVEAARADISQADAARYPSLGLSGSVGAQRVRSGGVTSDLSTWSIGPLSLSVPVLDGGRRQAVAASARVAYDEAVVAYGARVRQAVREVEEALVYLQSSASRGHDAAYSSSARPHGSRLAAWTQPGQRAEPEESRRQALAAHQPGWRCNGPGACGTVPRRRWLEPSSAGRPSGLLENLSYTCLIFLSPNAARTALWGWPRWHCCAGAAGGPRVRPMTPSPPPGPGR
jgi:hypothetical protein